MLRGGSIFVYHWCLCNESIALIGTKIKLTPIKSLTDFTLRPQRCSFVVFDELNKICMQRSPSPGLIIVGIFAWTNLLIILS